MAKHFFQLLDFKKAFEDAKAYHNYAIRNGSPEIKKAHLEHHIKGGNFDVLVQRPSTGNNTKKRPGG